MRHLCLNSSFNTQPPEGGWLLSILLVLDIQKFQHTAARRRLAFTCLAIFQMLIVSTHSRPKAAGGYQIDSRTVEGTFQHTAARRRLV